MGKFYVFILLIFTGQLAIAQTNYHHDDAGNRIQRQKDSPPLPVTLISFTAEKSEGPTALLTWQTSSEINADRFDIERSQDGKKWVNIGSVTANGDRKSSSWYSFSDKNPMDGENLYRLKMFDRDGTFSFSRIENLNFDFQISFYPNPVKDLLKIKGNASGAPVAGKVQLINNAGQVVYNSDNIPSEGIDMSLLPVGVYLVRITHNDGSTIVKKVVKQ